MEHAVCNMIDSTASGWRGGGLEGGFNRFKEFKQK